MKQLADCSGEMKDLVSKNKLLETVMGRINAGIISLNSTDPYEQRWVMDIQTYVIAQLKSSLGHHSNETIAGFLSFMSTSLVDIRDRLIDYQGTPLLAL
jgi:hypothetical protein